jgi:hypothetical protein
MGDMNKLAALLALLLWPALALGQTGAYSGHTFVGGVPATTSGMNSSNYMNGIIPGASVTVYLTGTSTKATIYADGSNTPLSNPFFSNLAKGTNPGGFIFWSLQNQGLDIQAQGGMGNASCTTSPLCYSTATTLQTDVYLNNSFASGCLGGNTIANGCTGATTAAGALANLGAVSTATTVNGHALSSNVTVSASDLTTGTLPHAQLPTLLSGDIPNNAANTTGNAATATYATSAGTATDPTKLPLTGGTLTGALTGTSASFSGNVVAGSETLGSPLLPASGGTGATTAAGANLNITGVTQTGTLGTSSQVSTFPGTVASPQVVSLLCGGTNDAAAIAAAIAALPSAGGEIVFPSGVCATPTQINLSGNCTLLKSRNNPRI